MASVYVDVGRHVFVKVEVPDVNARTPFESAWADPYDVPYNDTAKGRGTAVRQSSHALPMFEIPTVIVAAWLLNV
jgi:hypothetical protein